MINDEHTTPNGNKPKAIASTGKPLSEDWATRDERRLKIIRERLEAKRKATGKTVVRVLR